MAGPGSGLSEVPVWGCEPATLESESLPLCPPGPVATCPNATDARVAVCWRNFERRRHDGGVSPHSGDRAGRPPRHGERGDGARTSPGHERSVGSPHPVLETHLGPGPAPLHPPAQRRLHTHAVRRRTGAPDQGGGMASRRPAHFGVFNDPNDPTVEHCRICSCIWSITRLPARLTAGDQDPGRPANRPTRLDGEGKTSPPDATPVACSCTVWGHREGLHDGIQHVAPMGGRGHGWRPTALPDPDAPGDAARPVSGAGGLGAGPSSSPPGEEHHDGC